MSDQLLRRIDALIGVALGIARAARSGRAALARVAATLEPAWIPRPWGDEIAAQLEAASEAARQPLEFAQVERALRDAWGCAPGEELDQLDREPVAITPGAQVHRGILDGNDVAVKVLRPGLASAVRQDLALLEGLLAPLNAAFPALDAGTVIREIRERILEELDLEHEAATQRWFHRGLRGHPLLTVPPPVMRLAQESVLVSEWVEGVSLWRAPDPDAAAARLILFVLGGAGAGMIHADPDPDDVRVMPDGRLAILDFGATRRVDPQRAALGAEALEALIGRDVHAFSDALGRLGWLPARHGAAALELAREALGPLAESRPVRLDNNAVIAARDRLFGQPETLSEVVTAGALSPQDLWPARGVAQLFGTIARVGATGNWTELARTAIRDGWNA
jgi:predicted unusual protein kinase regulating ubiquinone biosynthesis (AarF/ABC1/UbiB family)